MHDVTILYKIIEEIHSGLRKLAAKVNENYDYSSYNIFQNPIKCH